MATAKAKKQVNVAEAAIAKAEPAKVAQVAQPAQPAQAAFNPFASAPKLEKVAPPKAKGKTRDEVELEGLDILAAFEVIEKVLEQEMGMIKSQVRQEVVDHYVTLMTNLGKKPDSFVGIGENSSASCEIRRRGSNMPMAPETAELLSQRGVSVSKNVKVPRRLVLNPDLPQEMLMKLAQIVQSDPELSKHHVVAEQEEEFSFCASETTLDELAATKDQEFIRSVVEQTATFAVGKFKLEGIEIESKSKDGDKTSKAVTPTAKSAALAILQKIGVFPK